MALERIPPEQLMVDLLDRVLDKGVVIDAAMRVSLVGIRLVEMEMQVVVASIETYLDHVDAEWAERRAAQDRARQVGKIVLAGSMREVEEKARGSAAPEERASEDPPEPHPKPR